MPLFDFYIMVDWSGAARERDLSGARHQRRPTVTSHKNVGLSHSDRYRFRSAHPSRHWLAHAVINLPESASERH
jgi:hypothetical protein